MHTNHNRIKVSDLETDDPDKILVTNSKGELEFIATKNIKVDSYNALDYDQEGKALDARQGKILKDLVNNKTDKGGFQGTAQDLANSIPDLNAANLKLGGYPNTRNDGQLPTNKILSTDANGNLRLYTMPISPAPYISELIPGSYLPDTTGNIKIIGDFFTPAMCDRVNNPNAIIIGGVAAIHYAKFINSQELLVNITTGSIEESFPATLNNGLQTTKSDALLIVLGDIHKPVESDWDSVTGSIDLSVESKALVKTKDTSGGAFLKDSFFKTDAINDFTVSFNFAKSPLEDSPSDGYHAYNKLTLHNKVDKSPLYVIQTVIVNSSTFNVYVVNVATGQYYLSSRSLNNYIGINLMKYSLKRVNGSIGFYENSVLKYTFSNQYNVEMTVSVALRELDLENIKLILQ